MTTSVLILAPRSTPIRRRLLRDGEIVAAAEEERFRRIKHWAGFPTEAIRYCLDEARVSVHDLDQCDHRDPRANLLKKALFSAGNRQPRADQRRLKNAARVRSPAGLLAAAFGADPARLKARFHNVEHHLAHLASAFSSRRSSAPWCSRSTASATSPAPPGAGAAPDRRARPGPLSALARPLLSGGDPAPGLPRLRRRVQGHGPRPLRQADRDRPPCAGSSSSCPTAATVLDLDCFRHHAEGVTMVWDGGAPQVERIFTDAMCELLGPPRAPGDR